MKIITVVGARPQFIKASVVSRALRALGNCQEVLVHTGQHYNEALSAVFFRELQLPRPDYNLNVGSASHGVQTAVMLERIERVLLDERPQLVIVYGDTNSTLAGALAAAKLHVLVAHVEAGLRSFRRDMPEEVNRVVTDHLADLLFAPTDTAVDNLKREGLLTGVHLVGDVMLDALNMMIAVADERSDIMRRVGCSNGQYGLATIHRAANTDDAQRLWQLMDALGSLDGPIVFPIHPRTRAVLEASPSSCVPPNVLAIDPVGYLDMLVLEKHARCILTDSGGVQKEAYFLGVRCVTLRDETEWIETLANGWNTLAGADAQLIQAAWACPKPGIAPAPVFGHGDAAEQIAIIVEQLLLGETQLTASATHV